MSASVDAPLSERTIHAGLWTIGARLSSRIVDFLTLLVLARFLGPADFGLVATAMTMIFIVEAVLELPLTAALVRLPDISPRAYNTAFTLGLLRGILVAAIMAASSLPLANFYGDARLTPLICALAIAPAMRGMISPRMVMFEKAMDFRRRGMLELIGKVFAAVVAAAIVLRTGSYWAIAASTLTTPAVMMLCSYVMAPMWPRLTLAEWPLFSQMIGWNFVSQSVSALNWQIDRILLPRYVDVAAFGRYTTADNLASLPSQAIEAPAAGPLLAAFAKARDEGRLKEAYLKSSASLVLVLMPILCFLAALSGPVIRVLFGDHWEDAAPILTGLALANLLVLPAIPMPPLAMVLDKSRGLAVRSFVGLIVRAPLSFAGIVFFGISGAVFAKAGSALAMSVASFSLTRSMTGIPVRDQLSVAIRPVLAVIPALAALSMCDRFLDFDTSLYASFLLSGMAYCLVYAAFTYVFWVAAGRPAGAEASFVRIASSYVFKYI
jgi:O-antigen/teichoic acid export membrane protein